MENFSKNPSCMSSQFTLRAIHCILSQDKRVCELFGSELLSVPKFSQIFHKSKLSVLLPVEVVQISSKKQRLIVHVIGQYSDVMDSDQLVYVLLSVLGQEIPVFCFGQQNIV